MTFLTAAEALIESCVESARRDEIPSRTSVPQASLFDVLVRAAAATLPRYRNDGLPGTILNVDAFNHLSSFLENIDFFPRAAQGLIAAAEVTNGFAEAAAPPNTNILNLVLLDGLEMTGTSDLGTARILEITVESMTEFLRGNSLPGHITLDRLEGVFAIETRTTAHNPPWGPTYFEWDAELSRAVKAGQPWLAHLNLWSSGKVRCIGAYQRCESLLVDPRVRSIGVEEPMWETVEMGDEEDTWEIQQLHHTLTVDDEDAFRAFLIRLEDGRIAAATRSHRVETAMRFWNRLAPTFLDSHILGYGDDADTNEDLIIDAVTGLEAIYLTGERGDKGDLLAKRAAALLESNSDAARQLRKSVVALYRLRSAILHGDERKPDAELRHGASIGEDTLRRSIVAFALLQGDQDRIIAGTQSSVVATENRQRVSL